MKSHSIARATIALFTAIAASCSAYQDNHVNNNNSSNHNIPITLSNNLTFAPEINTIITTIKEWGASLHEKAQNAATAQLNMLQELYTWLCENKIKTALACTLVAYLYLHYKLYTLKQELTNADNWSLWHRLVSLDEIVTMDQKEVADSLARAVQRRYTHAESPHDFVAPMTAFLQDVEQEKRLLKTYVDLCTWLRTCYLNKICWQDEELLATCGDRLKRLAYFKATFLNWLTDYKFAQNHVTPQRSSPTLIPEGADYQHSTSHHRQQT